MKGEEYQERQLEIAGWPVNLASYRIGVEWHCNADDVSPGAGLCRMTGTTREQVEQKAISRAEELLRRAKRRSV
jgi:hypothetical protein